MLSIGVFSLISLTSYWVDVHLHRILVYVRTKSNPGDLTPSLVHFDGCLDTICMKSYIGEVCVSRHTSLTCSKELLDCPF